MLKFLKVTGNSLSPFFLPDDFVLILKKPVFNSTFKPGSVIVFSHPDYGLLIKEVVLHDKPSGQIIVRGTHPSSTDSTHFGPISQQDVVGKVIWHIKNPAGHTTA